MHINYHKLLKIFIRIIILFAIILFYLNYRNNQCIIQQNCKPFFASFELSPFKKLKSFYTIYYKIDNNLGKIDFYPDENFNQSINKGILLMNNNEEKALTIKNIKESNNKISVYDDIDIINNNSMITKKFIITNKSNELLKIKTTMKLQPIKNYVKIYNCFCNSSIELEPYESKDLFIYMNVKDVDDKNYYSTLSISIMSK